MTIRPSAPCLLAATLALVLTACGAPTPEAAAGAFLEAAARHDEVALRACLVRAEREDLRFRMEAIRAVGAELGETLYLGSEARVPVLDADSDRQRSSTLVLLREEGVWRISLGRTLELMWGGASEGSSEATPAGVAFARAR